MLFNRHPFPGQHRCWQGQGWGLQPFFDFVGQRQSLLVGEIGRHNFRLFRRPWVIPTVAFPKNLAGSFFAAADLVANIVVGRVLGCQLSFHFSFPFILSTPTRSP